MSLDARGRDAIRPPPEGVIFDCDGVLVDSERIANGVLRDMLVEVGWTIDFDETVERFKGLSAPDTRAAIETRLGRALPDGFMDEQRARCLRRFESELRPVRGVEAVLRELDLPRCVASSSHPERLRASLCWTGLLGHFGEHVYSAAQVARGKPFPDLFLLAAERIGVSPRRCVVVEDSVAGVEAGVAAGMAVLGYADLTPADALARAGATPFTSMAQLPALLAR